MKRGKVECHNWLYGYYVMGNTSNSIALYSVLHTWQVLTLTTVWQREERAVHPNYIGKNRFNDHLPWLMTTESLWIDQSWIKRFRLVSDSVASDLPFFLEFGSTTKTLSTKEKCSPVWQMILGMACICDDSWPKISSYLYKRPITLFNKKKLYFLCRPMESLHSVVEYKIT